MDIQKLRVVTLSKTCGGTHADNSTLFNGGTGSVDKGCCAKILRSALQRNSSASTEKFSGVAESG